MKSANPAVRLIVFADDWGRHPSSCQHLISRLLDRYPTIWVDTVGMRRPGLSREDIARGVMKLRQWAGQSRVRGDGRRVPANLTVLRPLMWPAFGRRWQRRLNGALISAVVNRELGPRIGNERRVVITTVPITGSLVGRLDVDSWVYYCTDDFSSWPGLDGRAIAEMEQELVHQVSRVLAASAQLQARLLGMGRQSTLVTHGVDLAHWGWPGTHGELSGTERPPWAGEAPNPSPLPRWWAELRRPISLFWGLIDRKLDIAWIRALRDPQTGPGGSLVLVGPRQAPDPAIGSLQGVVMPGPVAYESLPVLATGSDVLIMPYADLPVTRSSQPLKFKEYLATGKPVVARRLPATAQWADAADLVETAEQFVCATSKRARHGVSAAQLTARRRLTEESWDRKVQAFEAVALGLT